MGDAPNFKNLGVSDPITGQNVFLSPQNIAAVMGATGGVAPTGLQAGIQGFTSGISQGTQIAGGISSIQAQQQGIEASKAQVANQTAATTAGVAHTQSETTGQDIQNSIQQQLQSAIVSANNNSLLAHAAQMKIQTQELQNTNDVLTAVNSGDPAQLAGVISNPKLILPSLQNDSLVEAAYTHMQRSGQTTPEQDRQFQLWNNTRDAFKQGPLGDQYNQAAGDVAGSGPIQKLKAASGISDTGQLLQGIQTKQVTSPSGQVGTALIAPNGASVFVNPMDPEDKAAQPLLSKFFDARERVATGGRYQLPLGAPVGAAYAAANPQQPTPPGGNVQPTSDGSTEDGFPAGQAPQQSAASQPQPQTPTANGSVPNTQNTAAARPNPNTLSATGVPLQASAPAAAPLNQKIVPGRGGTVASLAAQATQAQFAGSLPGTLTYQQATSNGLKEILPQIPQEDKMAAAIGQNQSAVVDQRQLARQIRETVKDAAHLGLHLGPTLGATANQAGQDINTLWPGSDTAAANNAGNAASKDPSDSYTPTLDDVISNLNRLQSQYQSITFKNSGLGASDLRDVFEQKLITSQGPGIKVSDRAANQAADILDVRANILERHTQLMQLFGSLNIPVLDAQKYANEYFSNPSNYGFTQDAHGYVSPTDKGIQDPIQWGLAKAGIDPTQLAQDFFSSPTQLPPGLKSQQPAQTPQAAGSGTATPFAPAQKNGVSTFPTPNAPQSANMRGVSYDNSQATQQDLHAIADAAVAGGNVAQFQQAGSVPAKLDKATPDLIARITSAESGGDPNAASGTGPVGLMELSNAAFKDTQKVDPTLTDRNNPRQNIKAGTIYFNQQLKKFDGNVDLSLAAFKDGPGAIQTMVDRHDINPATATVQQFAQFLPNADGNSTAQYITKITGQGRIQPAAQQQQVAQNKGSGFFDQINPFHVEEAQAEENTTTPPEPAGIGEAVQQGKWTPGQSGTVTMESGSDTGTGEQPAKVPSANDQPVKIPPVEPSPRNDVPPVSIISQFKQAAMQGLSDVSGFTTLNKGLKSIGAGMDALGKSSVGRFLADPKNDDIFQPLQNTLNGATAGLYDEGMGYMMDAFGLDGDHVRDGIREELKNFRNTNPKTALLTDIFGSVAGGAGAGVVFKGLGAALRGGSVAADVLAPSFTRGVASTLMKQGVAQQTVRGFGEGEGIKDRMTGAAIGATAGTLLSGVTALAGAGGGMKGAIGGTALGMAGGEVYHDFMGGGERSGEGIASGGSGRLGALATGAAFGAGLGASGRAGVATGLAGFAAGAAGGNLTSALKGGATGLGLGIAASTAMKNPAVQRVIARAVTKLNNQIGLYTAASMMTEALSGKTPAQIMAGLSGPEALLAKELQYVPDSELSAWHGELTNSKNPEIPVRLVDLANQTSAPNFVKAIRSLENLDPESMRKINQFLLERSQNQGARISAKVGALMNNETASRNVSDAIALAHDELHDQTQAVTRKIYAESKQATPVFDSPKLRSLMSAPAVKSAISESRKEFESALTSSQKQHELDLVNRLKDDQPVADLINEINQKPLLSTKNRSTTQYVKDYAKAKAAREAELEAAKTAHLAKEIPDNSFEIITEASRKLFNMAEDAPPKQKAMLTDLAHNLKTELETISPAWQDANITYAQTKGIADTLREPEITAIRQLGEGKIEQAIPKLMKLPPTMLQKVMTLADNPDAFKNSAKAFIQERMLSVQPGKDVSSKLFTPAKWEQLEPMLGDEADGIKSFVDQEMAIKKTGDRLGVGSPTKPLINSEQALKEAAGGGDMSEGLIGGHSIRGVLLNAMHKINPEHDPAFIKETADILINNAQKGPAFLEKYLKSRKMSSDEIDLLKPYLGQMQAAMRGGSMGVETSAIGMGQENRHMSEKQKHKYD